eukprot:TRINITY_DN3509_c0_g1_i1.p1 TRINITY_DN3509_c0_g1~~TRINITY_DN3509_c0_g1_i1.p1  ORF type:complete len:268 (-),score=23.46 TRINITY_DN3509_c0_g1_i1:288-1091(-)
MAAGACLLPCCSTGRRCSWPPPGCCHGARGSIFFAAPTKLVDVSTFPSGPHETDAAVPRRVNVHPAVWAAFRAQQLVPTTVRDAVQRAEEDGTPVTSIVFCGHGFGAAVAQLMAATWKPLGGQSRATSTTLITFGCPSGGNAAFQEWASNNVWHQRLFVAQDPVAGLPHSPCVGLSSSPSVREYAAVQADERLALSIDCQAGQSSAADPLVLYLSVAGVAFESYHTLAAYAECLVGHYQAVASWPSPSGAECTDVSPLSSTSSLSRR